MKEERDKLNIESKYEQILFLSNHMCENKQGIQMTIINQKTTQTLKIGQDISRHHIKNYKIIIIREFLEVAK